MRLPLTYRKGNKYLLKKTSNYIKTCTGLEIYPVHVNMTAKKKYMTMQIYKSIFNCDVLPRAKNASMATLFLLVFLSRIFLLARRGRRRVRLL